MTDKQREAVGIVLQQCYEKFLDVEAALTLIDAIIETAQFQITPPEFPPKVWYQNKVWSQNTYTDTDKEKPGEALEKRNNTGPF